MEKPIILLDTDMDTDCDDAGALAILLEAHLAGKATLLGIVADSVSPHAAPACDYMTRHYGIELPIGTVYAEDYMDTPENLARFADYRTHSKNCLQQGRAYNAFFARQINKTDKDYPSAVKVYRQLLCKAEDRSVTVLCVGMLTAVAEALESGPDEISSFSGAELFKRKVKKVIAMGNPYGINDFNWGKDALGAKQFFDLCPMLRMPAWWCKHSAGHGALIPALWCTPSAKDGAPMPFPMVHGGRRLWCTAAMLGLYL